MRGIIRRSDGARDCERYGIWSSNVRGRSAHTAQEILRAHCASVAVNLETTGLLKSVRFPFRSARISNFPSARPSRSSRTLVRLHAPFVEQAKLHSAGGCNFAVRILQTGMRWFDLHHDEERRGESRRNSEREEDSECQTHSQGWRERGTEAAAASS